MVVRMQSGTSIVAAVVVTIGDLAIDIRMIVTVGGSVVVTVVAVMVRCTVDIVWRTTMAASVLLPPSTVVAFVAKCNSCSDALPD